MIAALKLNTTDHQPWPHYVCDDFLERSHFSRIQKHILETDYKFRILEDDPQELQHAALAEISAMTHFLSPEFRNRLETLAGCKFTLRKSGAIQLRRMTPASPAFPCHNDATDERSLVMLYYVSPDWRPNCGGELVLHSSETSTEDDSTSKWVAPLENRAVLFFSEKTNWHSVRPVCGWTRYLILAEWLVA